MNFEANLIFQRGIELLDNYDLTDLDIKKLNDLGKCGNCKLLILLKLKFNYFCQIKQRIIMPRAQILPKIVKNTKLMVFALLNNTKILWHNNARLLVITAPTILIFLFVKTM